VLPPTVNVLVRPFWYEPSSPERKVDICPVFKRPGVADTRRVGEFPSIT
jgi:hypothetical protein